MPHRIILQIVPVHKSGPLVVTCCDCGDLVTQRRSWEHPSPSIAGLDGRPRKRGDVWADLDGEPFRAYYCNACARKEKACTN